MRRFSKLKKQIDGLFDPVLKMEFCCSAYPMRPKNGYANRSLPRFYVKLDKEIIWDFPKDFDVENWKVFSWIRYDISALVREYIDTPVDELLEKNFSSEQNRPVNVMLRDAEGKFSRQTFEKQDTVVIISLTDLFKAADRRISKKKIMEWSPKAENNTAYKIICIRLYGWECLTK